MFHIGREATVTIAGRPVRLGRLTRAVIRRWTEWAGTVLPDVLGAVMRNWDGIPAGCQKLLADAAIEDAEARRDFGSNALSDLWYSRAGMIQVLAFLMTELPLDLAVDLASQAVDAEGSETVSDWLTVASGRIVSSQYDLETRIYREAGFLPSPLPSRNKREWHEIDKDIFCNVGLTPVQVDEMTLPELIAVLSGTEEASDGDKWRRAEMYWKLTPAQRLKLAIWTATG